MNKSFPLLMVVIFVFNITGCAVGTIDADYRVPGKNNLSILDNSKSLVYGKLEGLRECAKEYAPEKLFSDPFTAYVIISKLDSERTEAIVEENRKLYTESEYPFYGWLPANLSEWFVWVLPVGEYEISTIRVTQFHFIEPANFRFRVPETGRAYYIGDLKLVLRETHYIGELCHGNNEAVLVDNTVAAKQYIEKYSNVWKGRFETQLMVIDEAELKNLPLIRRRDSKFQYILDPLIEALKHASPTFSF